MQTNANKRVTDIASPLSGKVIPLSEVPDPVFSEKVLGDGCAVLPSDGKIYSPVDGEISSVVETSMPTVFHQRMDWKFWCTSDWKP